MAMFLAGLRGIDGEIMKAAQIDGATTLQLYRRIVIPLLRPVFLSAFIVLAHLAIKSYDLVVALTSGGPGGSAWLPSNFMYEYTFKRNEMAVGSASAVIMLMTIAAIIVPYLYSELQGEAAMSAVAAAGAAAARRASARRVDPHRRSTALLLALRGLLPAAALRHAGDLVQDAWTRSSDGNMLALPQDADHRALAQGLGRGLRRRPPARASRAISGTRSRWWCRRSLISTLLGALNGYVLTKWRFRGHNAGVRADAVRLLHPVPVGAAADGDDPRHPRPLRQTCSAIGSTSARQST